MKIRASSKRQLHQIWCQETMRWSIASTPNSLWFYTLQQGIFHMLHIQKTKDACIRLGDVFFSGALLDWCYQFKADDFGYVLKLWNILGIENAQLYYAQNISHHQHIDREHLLYFRHIIEFMRDCSWYNLAIQMGEVVIKKHEDILGSQHIHTAEIQMKHALSLKRVLRFEEAIPLAEDALVIFQKQLSTDDPNLYVQYNSMASLYAGNDQYPLAEKFFQLAIQERTRLLGVQHPKTLISTASYAFLLFKMKRYSQALPLQKEVYEARSILLGDNHPKRLLAAYNYADNLCIHAKYQEAHLIIEDGYVRRIQVLGASHRLTIKAHTLLQHCIKKRQSLSLL